MYKLFLCLRYLRSRLIAYVAIGAVALCVAMMVIEVSVMNGFLDKIEHAAKGLFGDIVIEASGYGGIARYDELIARIRQDVPEVEAGSPFIISYAFLQIPHQPNIRKAVQVAGIRLPERTAVSEFGKGLYVQQGLAEPSFDPPVDLLVRRLAEENAKTQAIYDREEAAARKPGGLTPERDELLRRVEAGISYQELAIANLRQIEENRQDLLALEAESNQAAEQGDAERAASLRRRIRALQEAIPEPPADRAILGLGIPGLSVRTSQGETVRILCPGNKIILNIFPLGRSVSATDISPNTRRFSVVDDCRTDVWSIDSDIVYVPFDTLQVLNNMDQPNRCSQVHLKVRADIAGEAQLRGVARKVAGACQAFRQAYPDAPQNLEVNTWRQMQEPVIAPIQSQRTLVTTMFGIISLVSVVLIFAIFYMIVFQKTKEIGVMKAIGAGGGGVATIFLSYGMAVGLIGAALGVLMGYYFVEHINPIHDWVAKVLGFQVWSRKTFMFEKIPSAVDWAGTGLIVVGAIASGLVGALVPAIRAARMQPVEALRYE